MYLVDFNDGVFREKLVFSVESDEFVIASLKVCVEIDTCSYVPVVRKINGFLGCVPLSNDKT